MTRLIPILILATLVGCSAQQGGGDFTPAQRCEIASVAVATAETGVIVATQKADQKTRVALSIALAAAKTATADYCDALSTGADPDAVTITLKVYRQALSDVNAVLLQAVPPKG